MSKKKTELKKLPKFTNPQEFEDFIGDMALCIKNLIWVFHLYKQQEKYGSIKSGNGKSEKLKDDSTAKIFLKNFYNLSMEFFEKNKKKSMHAWVTKALELADIFEAYRYDRIRDHDSSSKTGK